LSLAVLSVGFAPAPLPRHRREASSANQMIGKWKGQHHTLVITHDRLDYTAGYEYALTIDPAVRPRAYEIRGVGSHNAGYEFHGIYRVEGDTLTLCYTQIPSPRPASFEGPGKGSNWEVYQRVR
jgi:uncharacterized protein (TIGR03067 family)